MKLNFEKSFKDAFIETVKAIDHKKINLLIHEIKKIYNANTFEKNKI